MLSDLKPYPAYQESGLPWLGKVPTQWNLIPNRALFRRRKVLVGSRHTRYRLLSLTKAGVIVRDVESGKGKFSADMGTSQEVRAGDLIFCLFDIPETPRTVGLSRHDGMITGAYTIFECLDPAVASFVDLFYRAMDDRKLLSPLYSGLRNTIPPSTLLGVKTPMPPPEEQGAIVRFLDHADRKIRKYIHVKQKLIKLLEQQEQGIIHQAVTRGFDPNVRLKPSGVDWLGDVPQHWELRRIRLCLESETAGLWGEDPCQENIADQIVCVRVADFDIDRRCVSTARLTTRAIPRPARDRRRLRSGDILMEKSGGGDAQPVGRVVLFELNIESVCSNFVARLRPRQSVVRPEFLMHVLFYLQATQRNIPSIKQTTGIQNLDTKHYLSNDLAVPPLAEQDAILAELKIGLAEVMNAQRRCRQGIDLVRELRTRLIADVVTGKLGVREAAAALPELPVEPLDEAGLAPDDSVVGDTEESETEEITE